MAIDHPLTDEHRRMLDGVLQSVPKALELCDAVHGCGVDMSDQIAILRQQQEMATKLKEKLFPYSV